MRLTPEEEVALRRITGLDVAPDGSAICYVIEEAVVATDTINSRLWYADVETSVSRPLTTGTGNERHPVWSPEGDRIAFVSTVDSIDRLMIVSSAGGRALELLGADAGFLPIDAGPVGGYQAGAHSAIAWSPDGTSIACLVRAQDRVTDDYHHEGPRPAGDPAVMTEITERLRGGAPVKLCVLGVESGELQVIAHGDHPYLSVSWSLEGGSLYAVEQSGGDAGHPATFRLLRLFLNGDAAETVEEFEGASFVPAISPDERRIAVSCAGRSYHAPEPGLYEREIGAQERRILSDDDRTFFYGISWSPDGDALVGIADRGVERRLVSIDLETGDISQLTDGSTWIEIARAAQDGETIAVVASTPDDPGDVFLIKRGESEPRRLTDVNPQRASFDIGEWRVVSWEAGDGTEIEGLLILPAGFDPAHPAPLILDYHGGPSTHVNLSWRGRRQIWASAGYAVLAPNFRGSTGYGVDFSEALRGDIGGEPYEDCQSGVDELITAGIADPDRLVIYGQSWGGYKTNWTVTQTDRFKAAVSYASICNLFSVYGTRYSADVWEWRLHGMPWESPDQYLEWSPLFYADRVRTPVLFLNGATDRTTPPTQGLEMFTALRKHDVPAEFVVYPREGHSVLEPRHRVDLEQRMLDWFDRWLDAR